MKNWSEHSNSERKEVFSKLLGVYEKHGRPAKLKNPKSVDEIINVLSMGEQKCNQSISISGKFSFDEKELVEALKKDLSDALAEVADAKVDISIALGVGDQFVPVENVGKFSEEGNTTLEHHAGEVMLIDFWATWCPPCQKPMAHNQEMLEKHAAAGDWKNVRIIGMSIDQDKEKLIKHVEDKKWTSVEHYWARNGTCTADKTFQVRGVPHCLLVDKHGKIVWIGHPASRNLEEDINNLLADKVLEVKAGSDDESDEEAKQEDEKPIDTDAARVAVDTFIKDSKELGDKEEFRANAYNLSRAFLVLVNETTCDLANAGKIKSSLTCHTVLVGP